MTAHLASTAAWLALTLLPLGPAYAFAYLEHSWVTDRACSEALARLAPAVAADETLAARYLALALVCPERAVPRYCVDDRKTATAQLNLLEDASDAHGVTLGDFAALPDHYSRYGPVRGLDRAGVGLLGAVLGWLGDGAGGVGGIIEDVAEEGCDDSDVPWEVVERDVSAELARLRTDGHLPAVPQGALSALDRAPPAAGPDDPHALYSFDNPHYLDLVLRNHGHFGAAAYGRWLGFHTTAVDLAEHPCAATLGLDGDALEDIADDAGGAFADVEWDDLDADRRREQGCAMLRERVRGRVERWLERGEAALTAPVRALALDDARLDAVVSALMAAVFEGAGLHYLQDDLAGGHLRTDRTAVSGLADSRFTHDLDGDLGVAARLDTLDGSTAFVAFGDGRLLGPALAPSDDCDTLPAPSREATTACLLRRQRGLLVATTAASLLDWALGGAAYQPPAAHGCDAEEEPRAFVCRALPMRPVSAGPSPSSPPPETLARGDLPVPPPPFSYESVLIAADFDATGGPPRLGARLELLTELGDSAGWMRSYDLGVLVAPASDRARYDVELAHLFHFRWAARFLVNAGPYVYVSATGLGDDPDFVAGVGPDLGLTFLPEGWTQAPLEFTLNWRMPLRLIGGAAVEAHFVGAAIGLAFM